MLAKQIENAEHFKLIFETVQHPHNLHIAGQNCSQINAKSKYSFGGVLAENFAKKIEKLTSNGICTLATSTRKVLVKLGRILCYTWRIQNMHSWEERSLATCFGEVLKGQFGKKFL